jgi:CBS domain-containing protein
MLAYKAIEIITSERSRYHNKPLSDAVIHYIRELKIAARCMVTRGIAGCYESGETATQRLEILSLNLPVRIYIVLPAAQAGRVLQDLNAMLSDGIIVVNDLQVVVHRARNALFPPQLTVRDVMTAEPTRVAPSTALSEVARGLLSSIFTGVPVVDQQGRPLGVITQGDLIQKGGMPLRLGLLAESDQERCEAVMDKLAQRSAADAMSAPAVTIGEDRPLGEAVEVMLTRGVKRLPVVDRSGFLTGMLSRLDIFKTVMREAPDWKTFRDQEVEIAHLRTVADIVRRDSLTVASEAAIGDVIQAIDRNDLQRVAVIDATGKLLGLISDRDLLSFFKQTEEGIWSLLEKVKRPFKVDPCRSDLQQCLRETKARDVMRSDLITVSEEMLIEEAIRLMTEKALKRLPVVDPEGRFKGLISRDSLLRTGYGGAL